MIDRPDIVQADPSDRAGSSPRRARPTGSLSSHRRSGMTD
jgi:hypothetical protein